MIARDDKEALLKNSKLLFIDLSSWSAHALWWQATPGPLVMSSGGTWFLLGQTSTLVVTWLLATISIPRNSLMNLPRERLNGPSQVFLVHWLSGKCWPWPTE